MITPHLHSLHRAWDRRQERAGKILRGGICCVGSPAIASFSRAAAEARQPEPSRRRGFTLTELLMVITIIAVVSAALPALSGSLQGSALNNGTRTAMNLLTVARTEAITRRELVRFAVAPDWRNANSAGYRKFSLWASATGDADSWKQISRWEELPAGIVFDPDAAGYIASGSRPANGGIFANPAESPFSTMVGADVVTMRYLEFTPSGGIRANGGAGHEIWFALAAEPNGVRAPANWAVLAANVHTGRFRHTRPGS